MKSLTPKESEIMHIIWDIEPCLVHDIIDQFTEKAPYNTISSVVRILEKKEFVAHKAYGKTHEYYSIISKTDYSEWMSHQLLDRYYEGSPSQLVSQFAKVGKISATELSEIKLLIDQLSKQ